MPNTACSNRQTIGVFGPFSKLDLVRKDELFKIVCELRRPFLTIYLHKVHLVLKRQRKGYFGGGFYRCDLLVAEIYIIYCSRAVNTKLQYLTTETLF
jgi:hypothetical protein